MKHFISALLFVSVLSSAHASPHLAKGWGELATEITSELDAAERRHSTFDPISPELRHKLQRFGLLATQLGAAIQEQNGPNDLACIFRGMAEDTAHQLAALSKGNGNTGTTEPLERIRSMLDDASTISQSAEIAFREHATMTGNGDVAACPAVRP